MNSSSSAPKAPEITKLREKIIVEPDASLAETASFVELQTTSGARYERLVTDVLGSSKKPMSDAQLHRKFMDQSEPVIGARARQSAWERAMALASIKDKHRALLVLRSV